MKVLVVEDSQMVSRVLQRLFQTSDIPLETIFCSTLKDAQSVIDHQDDIFVALVDLNLPDAPDGEVVELMLAQSLPTIVLTSSYNDQRREALLKLGVVDYIVKESRFSYEYTIQLIQRLIKNQHIKILVTDDSSSYRQLIRKHLERHLYQVCEAEHGRNAIEMLQQEPDIRLLLTDYEMPVMDGIELIQCIRKEYETSDLKIIGLSAADNPALSSKFIKSGANDFLKKPFNYEELHCRVMHNLQEMELVEQIKEAANRDYLTGLHNRRYLFDQASGVMSSSASTCLAMMDLDLFKSINDTYGHNAGDAVLIQIADLMKRSFQRFLLARIGGEEFCILLPGLNLEQSALLMQHFCQLVHDTTFEFEQQELPVTVSIGLAQKQSDNLTKLMNCADEMLYKAKESGRNRVVYE
ncbi:diguanylate cyclase [uncultured Neptuniibacter sp.]|uniref:GGDEF domain-containing response regulator n=1 Tax=uncultured Neptuniibacter sp. TaxID=502143 RepID=UPI00260E51A4|nr:diguanylate cyclase [uncultured Neptuniibacter sp.]